ncbi:AAA family ATPase (plasmid) [Rhodococcus opacus]|uniref:TrlF family AAA-like ATPase n=1 Tax=Rhodococcus opacus TaxID=37919 RepID=UPI00146F5C3A|nr:AAA family ATPase [Rhodococcus opacus]
MSDWAKFWAVDLHVHTPGSQDAKVENYGTATEIVGAAMAAGLDAIAVTDHNTVSWCKQVAEAAAGNPLIVLPGVEISTTEGHLLAIWEEGTEPTVIEEVLVRLGIGHADRGKLDIAAAVGFADAATLVEESGGLAIAAHVEKDKGLLKLAVKAHLKKTLLNQAISAVEVVHMDTVDVVERTVANERTLAFVRGSDTWDPAKNCHSLIGIGARRTWIKASRPDLVGLRHAFADPDLRISLHTPPVVPPYRRIESIEIVGGFLGGQKIQLSPDLNCLLGGTGAGKSLILEAVRFALDQQVDSAAFPAIRQEIDSRMAKALMNSSVVLLHVAADDKRFRIERTFDPAGSAPSRVLQQIGTDWAEIDVDPASICPLAAFSQGEILEYSREPVGRMTLIDSSLDLDQIDNAIDATVASMKANARQLIAARAGVRRLQEETGKEAGLAEQVRQLTDLFKTDAVKEQASWATEQTALKRAKERLDSLQLPQLDLPDAEIKESVAENADLFASAASALAEGKKRVDAARAEIESALASVSIQVGEVQTIWGQKFEAFKKQLDDELEKVDAGASLSALRANLEHLQSKLTQAQASKEELNQEVEPELARLVTEREDLIKSLQEARRKRRELRRERVRDLNAKAAGFVKLDIPSSGDASEFRQALDQIKVGSRVREEVLNQLALNIHPLKFARSMWNESLNDIVNTDGGVDLASVAKLFANIDEKDLWEELLEIQGIDRPDVLTIKFKKPNDQSYTTIEELAHGQRCTAILVILLADGNTPVLVDQPEDALHAPWIEDYLVDRLRSLRGTRQYLFATRSPGVVVSGDAEQIVTMKATAGHGEVEAAGSLERHALNKLALDHLEGGPIPFKRRTSKLGVSVTPS